MNALSWHPHVGPFITGVIVLALAGWLYYLYRRYSSQHLPAATWMLLAPKILATLLLLTALLDPAWRAPRPREENDRVLTLIDVSSSMDVADSSQGTRAERAAKLKARIESELGDLVAFKTETFDVDLHATDAQPDSTKVRGTDLGKVLATLSSRSDLAAYRAVVLLTDGGDENIRAARLPALGLYIVGTGTDPSTWNDLAIADVQAPDVVEETTSFDISVDVIARSADSGFAQNLSTVAVSLQEEQEGTWKQAGSKSVKLAQGRARVGFHVEPRKEVDVRKFRVHVKDVPGELSLLNNQRDFTVDVRKKTFYVLLYSRSLDWDFALLRRELTKDPAIKITSLYRVDPETNRIEGDRQEGDDVLQKGLPADANVLRMFKCIILGSFPAEDLRADQQLALRKYVEQGGSIVFLGGPESFGRGGYADSELAPLIPWHISRAEGEIIAGRFPVTVSPYAREHATMSAMAEVLSKTQSPVVFSINPVGKPRTGAVGLVNAALGDQVVPLIALQRYGQGQCLGIASNTLWRWGRMSEPLRKAYHEFWQNSIRYLSGLYEGNRFLMVKWDREKYRPSEIAEGTLQLVGRSAQGQLRFSATLTHGKQTQKVAVEPIAGGEAKYQTKIFFPDRGEYVFRVEANSGFDRVDSYERTFRVGPTRNEGARLEVDQAFLDDVASRSGGLYASETSVDRIIQTLRDRLTTGSVETDVRLVEEHGIFFALLLTVLLAEWVVRRRMNLF